MCWRSRWRSAVKRVRCSSASGRCNNSVMLLQPDVLYSSSEICLLPSCHSVSELYIWLCTLLLRRVCVVAMCCRSILFGHKYKCWYFSVSCTVLFDGTDMQKCTRSATFTLGVFYDRHAGCMHGCMQHAYARRRWTVRRRRHACRLHACCICLTVRRRRVQGVDVGQSSVDFVLSGVNALSAACM